MHHFALLGSLQHTSVFQTHTTMKTQRACFTTHQQNLSQSQAIASKTKSEDTAQHTAESKIFLQASRICSSLGHSEQISNLHESLPYIVVATTQTFRSTHSTPIISINKNNCAASSL